MHRESKSRTRAFIRVCECPSFETPLKTCSGVGSWAVGGSPTFRALVDNRNDRKPTALQFDQSLKSPKGKDNLVPRRAHTVTRAAWRYY
ncbi:hypothetical protein J6590_077547 [Homalodisca vitripennis]|nr:hypothetical protein J6590_077547 [Homalodisca vitripennis]